MQFRARFRNLHGIENKMARSYLVVQWWGLHAFTAKDMDSVSGEGTKIPQATWHGQKKKKKTTRTKLYVLIGITNHLF